MKSGFLRLLAAFAFIAVSPGIAGADDRSEYNQRAASLFSSVFETLDRDTDRSVTLSEARGDLTFMPRFDDMDINNDGSLSQDELTDTHPLRQAFTVVDSDGNGTLSRSEVDSYRSKMAPPGG